MFFAVFVQKFPEVPLRVYDSFEAASTGLSKLKKMGRQAWITEFDFQLLCYYTNAIDTEIKEIFDYTRFEKLVQNPNHRNPTTK